MSFKDVDLASVVNPKVYYKFHQDYFELLAGIVAERTVRWEPAGRENSTTKDVELDYGNDFTCMKLNLIHHNS